MHPLLTILPEIEFAEQAYIQSITKDWSDEKLQHFALLYRLKRKDPMLILGTTLVGFIWIGGVQRFILGQIGMGILYLFTVGLCFIGTIVDLVNYKQLTLEYNQQQAQEIILLMK